MSKIRHLFTAAALVLCALLPTAAVAQLAGKKVLFLSTTTGAQYAGNAKDAFSAAHTTLGGSPSDFTTNLGALAGGSYSKEDIKKADIVVLMDSSGSVADYATKIKPLMEDRAHDGRDGRPLTFIIFTSANAANTNTAPGQFAKTIKDITGWTDAHHTHIPSSGYTSVPLIANSTLASFFKGINAAGEDTAHPDDLRVNTYGVMQCVPKDNRIYGYNTQRCQRNRFTNSTAFSAGFCRSNSEGGNMMEDLETYPKIAPPTENLNPADAKTQSENAITINTAWTKGVIDTLHPDSAASIIVPQWQSSGGDGACIIFTIDANIYDNQGTGDQIFDHKTQREPLAEALLKAAVDKAACLQDKPAKSILAPAYNGAPDSELAISLVGGKTEGVVSDNSDKEVVVAGSIYNPTTQTCSAGGVQCTSFMNALTRKCCSKVLLPSDIKDSCSTPLMYCSADNHVPSEALSTLVCCTDTKRAKNTATGDICCDGSNPQPTGAPGSQICCKAGQANVGGMCKALPASGTAAVPTTGWPALLGLSALLPLLAARRRRK